MAANFWTSCHRKGLMEKRDVDVVHPVDKERGITLEDLKIIKMGMSIYVKSLASRIDYLRQRVVATAVAYMRRFYTRRPLTDFNPRIVAPTCLYLASKTEECSVQAATLVKYHTQYCNHLISVSGIEFGHGKFTYEVKDICEMEMKILEALNDYLLVFHPYRSLGGLLQDAGMDDADMIQTTWGILNDTYMTDLVLVHPPHLIAVACIFVACAQKDKDATTWFQELTVDMKVVTNISLEILDCYEERRSITRTRVRIAFGKIRELKDDKITSNCVTISPP